MPTFLENVGTSGAGTSLANYAQNQRKLALEKEFVKSRTAFLDTNTEISRNQLLQLRREQAENNKEIPFQLMLDGVKVPEAKQYISTLATSLGYVNPNGTIRVANARQLRQYLDSDGHKENLSMMKLNHAKSQYELLKKASEDPEFAKKNNIKLKPEELFAQLSAARDKYMAAQIQSSRYQEYLKNQASLILAEAQMQKALRDNDKVQTWLLPNSNEIVRSYDQGKTYLARDGSQVPMPYGASLFRSQYTGQEQQALKEGKSQTQPQPPPESQEGKVTKGVAIEGTGFWSNMAALFDAIAGGVGVDRLFGKEGFFVDIQDARQSLRILKQTAKSAFLNSDRGAIWEQRKIDELFPNPDKLLSNPETEARKLPKLRQYLLELKYANELSIQNSIDMKELQKYRGANAEVERILKTIGGGEGSTLSQEDNALINRYLK